ncbi:MAG: NAD-dependent succinate-semialdehyde dehydrogenase [Acidiferrobacterales bacterium]
MALATVNPFNGEHVKSLDGSAASEIDVALAGAAGSAPTWAATTFARRAALMRNVSAILRGRSELWARLITLEMGKIIREARAEVEKCAVTSEFYAEHAERFLADEKIQSDAGLSYVAYFPLGTVLAVMPWNFPFWQVFRFAAPALMAGNTVVLKHASNVPQCSLAIEAIFREAGFPEGVFRSLLIPGEQVQALIADPRIHAVSVTGSEATGRKIAAAAGAALKKTVLELGGSDAFVVLADADLELAASVGVAARYLNGGQSCIAAKRFILVESVADRFLELFRRRAGDLKQGDPSDEDTHIGPMARADLRDELDRQVQDSIRMGAVPVMGCGPVAGPGFFYRISILDHVQPGMRAYEEELFGPVAIVIRAADEDDALRIANDSRYGLGGSIWTRDTGKGEHMARRLQSGTAFVNGMVKSDARLPFGGIKASGYGRELSYLGIREFVNAKTVWIK